MLDFGDKEIANNPRQKRKGPEEVDSHQEKPSTKKQRNNAVKSVATPMGLFSHLPVELLLKILSSLSVIELSKIGLVNHTLRKWSQNNELWKNIIRYYFPYLEQVKKKEYQNNPRKLFEEEYTWHKKKFIKSAFPNGINHEFILFALSSSLEKIEASQLSENDKTTLYALAAANGHLNALEKLDEKGKGRTLRFAAQKGRLEIVQTLLAQAGAAISDENKGLALCGAVGNGHREIVQTLLAQAGAAISDEHKRLALYGAAEDGHREIVQTLLAQAGAAISDENKGKALYTAAYNGHLAVVQTLLVQAGAAISAEHKALALYWAAQNGHLAVVQTLLVQAGAAISARDKGLALQKAAQNGHLEITQTLLAQAGAAISDADKRWALWQAAENGHLAVVQTLLVQAGTAISAGNKGWVLKLTAKNNYPEIVKVLQEYTAREELRLNAPQRNFIPSFSSMNVDLSQADKDERLSWLGKITTLK